MKAKVTTKIFLKDMPKNIKKNFAKSVKLEMGKAITDHIQSGKSPVKAKQFKQYSKEYANRHKGGSRKPVTMKRSGSMLKSLYVKQNRLGQLLIGFSSEIAKFHDILGAGKSKIIRRLLPTRNGEQFGPRVGGLLIRLLRTVTKKEVKKQNKRTR